MARMHVPAWSHRRPGALVSNSTNAVFQGANLPFYATVQLRVDSAAERDAMEEDAHAHVQICHLSDTHGLHREIEDTFGPLPGA